MTASSVDLDFDCRRSIQKGSKTFFFASLFFGKREARAASLLYAWCRYCDDEVDKTPSHAQGEALKNLRDLTEKALNSDDAVPVPFEALRRVVRDYRIPQLYPLELLNGMQMDVEGYRYKEYSDLEIYCYRVAGVVGLMMAHVMGVSDEKALRSACDLGIAMQLTNCVRDIREDLELGRVYLPIWWLRSENVKLTEKKTFNLESDHESVFKVAQKLLAKADTLYRTGEDGVDYLSLRCSLVILIARFTYARIGKTVMQQKEKAWRKRSYTSAFRKLQCLGIAICVWCWRLPGRPSFRPVDLGSLWRLP